MSRPTKDMEIEKLRRENESLLAQLEEFRESHETLRAIRVGEVDALVVSGLSEAPSAQAALNDLLIRLRMKREGLR